MAQEQWQYRTVLVLIDPDEPADEAIAEAGAMNRGWDRDPLFGAPKMVGQASDGKRQWKVGLRRPFRIGPDVEEDFSGYNDR